MLTEKAGLLPWLFVLYIRPSGTGIKSHFPYSPSVDTGLEARPVAQLVQVASQFNSEIYVEIGKKKVNAKSIMGMMTLGLDSGEEITLSANGEDEEAAMSSIEQYLSNQN